MLLMFPSCPQRTHNTVITSLLRRNDVETSLKWRYYRVVCPFRGGVIFIALLEMIYCIRRCLWISLVKWFDTPTTIRHSHIQQHTHTYIYIYIHNIYIYCLSKPWEGILNQKTLLLRPSKFGNGYVISPTLYNGYNHLSMLVPKLIHCRKRGHSLQCVHHYFASNCSHKPTSTGLMGECRMFTGWISDVHRKYSLITHWVSLE